MSGGSLADVNNRPHRQCRFSHFSSSSVASIVSSFVPSAYPSTVGIGAIDVLDCSFLKFNGTS